ncbi:MAG: prolipoprotein diacylglyceryl transferase [Candidatus Obscuribacterales bacterium]|nr:prolipoprotein diacylglyceryl transferase [Candidatus Obscuribacterales bacterium]
MLKQSRVKPSAALILSAVAFSALTLACFFFKDSLPASLTLQSPGPYIFVMDSISFQLNDRYFATGPIPFTWYSLLLIVGFVIAAFAGLKKANEWEADRRIIWRGAVVALIGGLIGAKLYWIAVWAPEKLDYILMLIYQAKQGNFQMPNTGMAIHGAILGVLISMIFYCRKHAISLLKYLDLIFIVLPLAQSIWRWGNFFNSETFGSPLPESARLKLFIPYERRPDEYVDSNYFHPTFLYEAVWDFSAFLLLYFLLAKRLKDKHGVLSCLYLIQYAICRLIIEPIRIDGITINSMNVPILASQVCLFIGTAGLFYLCFIRYRKKADSNK